MKPFGGLSGTPEKLLPTAPVATFSCERVCQPRSVVSRRRSLRAIIKEDVQIEGAMFYQEPERGDLFVSNHVRKSH